MTQRLDWLLPVRGCRAASGPAAEPPRDGQVRQVDGFLAREVCVRLSERVHAGEHSFALGGVALEDVRA